MEKNNGGSTLGSAIGGVLIIILIGLVASCLNNDKTPSDSSNSNNSYIPFSNADALTMAKDICKYELKSPSSAKWGSSVNITSLGNDKYSVSGNVESKNSYGVMISAKYFAYFTFTGRGYKDGYCSIVE